MLVDVTAGYKQRSLCRQYNATKNDYLITSNDSSKPSGIKTSKMNIVLSVMPAGDRS